MLDGSLLPVSLRTSAAVAGAFIIGAYIIFGTPTDITGRRRRRKDLIPGLANIGNSCFLNALVQGLSSCPMFISWLSSRHSATGPPLVSALHSLLRVLNNEEGGEGDACAGQVLGALRGHGWVISSEEQDTHELFHVLTSTIDDELTTASSVPSLLDVAWVDVSCITSVQDGVALKADTWQQNALGFQKLNVEMGEKLTLKSSSWEEISMGGDQVDRDSESVKEASPADTQSDASFLNSALVDDKNEEATRGTTSANESLPEPKVENTEPATEASTGSEANCDRVTDITDSAKQTNTSEPKSSTNSIDTINREEEKTTECDPDDNADLLALRQATRSLILDPDKENDGGNARVYRPVGNTKGCEGVEGGKKGYVGGLLPSRCPPGSEGWKTRGDQHDIPFRGYLASQLQCTFCRHKNPAQWTSFESLSLSLPAVPWGDVSLTELLDAYVTPEKVTDVSCDGCSRRARSLVKTTFTKQLTIGKLPECLCFHIKRTVWLDNGSAIKRRDHLTFPEFLVMDPYTYTTSITSQSDGRGGPGKEVYQSGTSITSALESRYQHSLSSIISQTTSASYQELSPVVPVARVRLEQLYRLCSVIVHVGDVFCGHFVTYRRGPISSRANNRWFYTSDLLVREANLEEVRKANAYMIMYEKVT